MSLIQFNQKTIMKIIVQPSTEYDSQNMRANGRKNQQQTFKKEMASAPQDVIIRVSFRSLVRVSTKMMKNWMPPRAKNLPASCPP